MPLLDSIHSPADVRALSAAQLADLAQEIRSFLISSVSHTGGHLGPNLGVVELTIALHRVFDSPTDAIVFDTGHQSYVHKILTGRKDAFATLRQHDGLSGYPKRAESEHDWVENSHASTSIGWAFGLARGFAQRGEDRHVVAVVGDGALTGGLTWEALNNISTNEDLKLVVLVNDNGLSYTPTVGGVATQLSALGRRLSALRTDRRYERFMKWLKRLVQRTPVIGEPAYGLLHGFKTGVRDVLLPRSLYPNLSLKYIGPINGHDEAAVEVALQQAKSFGGPTIVHCITEKGRGFTPAEDDEKQHFHAVGRFDEITGERLDNGHGKGFSKAFGDELLQLAGQDERIVAITAAMLDPVGLTPLASRFPKRVYDVGIAEQVAVTMAAGLSAAGMHPVVAVYSTFLNRAYDQVLMDVGLHRQGVTFVLDRAGVTGPDGASHHGMWDVPILATVPGLRLATVRDEPTLRARLREAVQIDDAPTVLRYPRGAMPKPFEVVAELPAGDVLYTHGGKKLLLVAYGLPGNAVAAAKRMENVTVIDPRWALPVSEELVRYAAEFDQVITVEDNLAEGGLGSRLAQQLPNTMVQNIGIPKAYLGQGSRKEVLKDIRLDAAGITAQSAAGVQETGPAEHGEHPDERQPADAVAGAREG
ncbi:MAG: 1-deoxy-D-xylulose-5-phosphate synthase [Propionibacteriaceae bacterium]|nr:1-deoxy-D-xylulose-5-phosphate synthase [Propionibacteriaceae bacterium]